MLFVYYFTMVLIDDREPVFLKGRHEQVKMRESQRRKGYFIGDRLDQMQQAFEYV